MSIDVDVGLVPGPLHRRGVKADLMEKSMDLVTAPGSRTLCSSHVMPVSTGYCKRMWRNCKWTADGFYALTLEGKILHYCANESEMHGVQSQPT